MPAELQPRGDTLGGHQARGDIDNQPDTLVGLGVSVLGALPCSFGPLRPGDPFICRILSADPQLLGCLFCVGVLFGFVWFFKLKQS